MPSIASEIIPKTRVNTGESTLSSDCDLRLPRSLDSPPVDAFEQHRKLRATQLHGATLGLRPDESAAFQPLSKQTQTIAIPPQQFYDIASAPAKYEHVYGEGQLLQYGLHLAAESIEAAAHVRHAGRNPDLRSSGKLDHWRKLSSTARTREPSAPLSMLINARPGSSIWIAPALDAEVSRCCSTTSLAGSVGVETVTGSNAE